MAKKSSSNNKLSNLNFMNLKVQEYSILLGLFFSLVFLMSIVTLAKNDISDSKVYGSVVKGSPNNLAAVLAIILTIYGLLKAKKMWHQVAITISFSILLSAYCVYLFALS